LRDSERGRVLLRACCSVLQHTATHCNNTLQHTATRSERVCEREREEEVEREILTERKRVFCPECVCV